MVTSGQWDFEWRYLFFQIIPVEFVTKQYRSWRIKATQDLWMNDILRSSLLKWRCCCNRQKTNKNNNRSCTTQTNNNKQRLHYRVAVFTTDSLKSNPVSSCSYWKNKCFYHQQLQTRQWKSSQV